MTLSEWIAKLQNVLQHEGDVNVYVGDMEAPRLEINRTVDREDVKLYGEMYLSIEAGG